MNVNKVARFTVEQAFGEFQARAANAHNAGLGLIASAVAVEMVSTVLAMEGQAVSKSDATKAMRDHVSLAWRGGGSKMLQIYVITASRAVKKLCYTKSGEVRYPGFVSAVGGAATVADAIEVILQEFAALCKSKGYDRPTLDALRRALDYTTRSSGADPAKAVASAIKAATETLKDDKAKPEVKSAVRKALAGITTLDMVLTFIRTAAAAGDVKTLDMITAALTDPADVSIVPAAAKGKRPAKVQHVNH